ncbi:MAG: prephenate dehydratase domain-containing protein [Patescibacteria group bacterium]|nr:prephenate dehydratase domain-containing protein [Patescibacteria group bacterium]
MKIGICGSEGSFSEEAANHYCGKNKIEEADFDYLITAENVLTALDEGNVDLGIFPIENSNGGVVIEAVHAMACHNFEIEKIFEIDVRHFLHCRKGCTVGQIKKITSHSQALKQCRMYLKRKWEDTEIEEYADTAKATKDLGEGRLGDDVAVIAPEGCAKLYGLDVLEEGIQDLKFNYTSFIAAKKK